LAAAVRQILANRRNDRLRQRHEFPFPPAFAENPRRPELEVGVLKIQAAQFADPEPEAVERQDDRVIALIGR
jgi:hypothetical protein